MTNSAIPESMNAVEIIEPGGPEKLKLTQRGVPKPAFNEVLIKNAFAGVNRPDCLQRAGGYPPPPGVTDIPGLEIAGTIIAAGENVPSSNIGRDIMALAPGGGYAEYVCVDLSNTLAVPSNLSLEQASAIPETFFTVWHNVFQRGQLKAGETFLVHGGTSGIGTTAIQLAKAFGATVFATAGSDEKCNACLDLGADHAINYRDQAFEEVTKELTGGKGIDVILDMVGGDYVSRNYKAAAMDGRIVQIAFLGGPKTQANFLPIMLKRLTHTGSTLRARSVEFKAQIANELQQQVWPLIENGSISPVMDQVFKLAEAQNAHSRMESSAHIGKIVLEV